MNLFCLTIFVTLLLMLTTAGDSLPSRQELKPPEFSNSFSISMANNLIKQGQTLLEDGDAEGAIAKFEEIRKLVTSKWMPDYQIACAYARAGQKANAIEKLNQLVRNGFDYPDKLNDSADLESLRDDPQFNEVALQAQKNYEEGTAALIKGIPEYDETTGEFSNEEELDQWVKEQDGLHYRHRSIWTATELLTAKIDMRARYLAALKAFRSGDPDFDYGRERVRAAICLNSLARPGWGVITDIVQHEVDAYARSALNPNALAEAYFLAGMASSLKYTNSDPHRIDGYDQASYYLEKIDEGNQYYGPAKILMLVNELMSPDTNEERAAAKLNTSIQEFPDNHDIYSIISTRLNHDAVRVLWPIPLDVPDIDDDRVSLDKYRGRVVLIDFWAISCIPCVKELPHLVEVYNKYHNDGFEIISICLDSADKTTLDELRRWISDKGMKWRHIYDGRAWKSELVQRFFIGTIPAPFLVSRDGKLIASGPECRGEELAVNVLNALTESDIPETN
jgi:thiol-disulfide isomerase/thioredoxin